MASQTTPKPATQRITIQAPTVAVKKLPMVAKNLTPAVKVATKKTHQNASKPKTTEAVTPIKAQRASKPVASKGKKAKLVRDSFTIPKDEYLALQKLKERASALAKPAKKSELLRAGLLALANMADTVFLATLAAIPALKTGRPKGAKASKK